MKIENEATPLETEKPITLQGVHCSIYTPTEERLIVQVRGLSPLAFRNLSAEFEDQTVVVNDKHKNKSTRGGRSWKGRGHKLQNSTFAETPSAVTNRMRGFRGSPYPSAFSNTLSSIRRELYIALRQHCFVLDGDCHGGYKQNVYIMPFANALSMLAIIEEQNKRIDKLNEEIEEFQHTRYWVVFKGIFGKYEHCLHALLERNWRIEHIRKEMAPLMLEPTTVLKMIKTARGITRRGRFEAGLLVPF